MPADNTADTLELSRNNTSSNYPLNSSGITMDKITSTCGIMSRTDNYNEDDSDSNSEDGGLSSPESDEPTISKLEDSENLEKSEITSLLQNLSMHSNRPADSVGPRIPERQNSEAWTRSSWESSHPSTCNSESSSDDNSDSSDDDSDSSEDEEKRKCRADIISKLKKFHRDHNSNYRSTSQDDDEEHENENPRALNSPVSSEDEQNDSTSDDTSENEPEVFERGAYGKQPPHSSKKPYNRQSPKYASTYEPRTPENTTEETSTTGYDNEQILKFDYSNINDEHITEIYNRNPKMINDAIDRVQAGNHIYGADSSTKEPPVMDRNRNPAPTIFIDNTAAFLGQSSQMLSCTIPVPLSSTGSSNLSDNERSPASYVDPMDTFINEEMIAGMESMHTEPTIDCFISQVASPMQLSNQLVSDNNQHETIGYTLPNLDISMPEIDRNIYTGFNIQMEPQVQTSPNQITSPHMDTFPSCITTTTQGLDNGLQTTINSLQPCSLTTQITSRTNPCPTSWGIVTCNPSEKNNDPIFETKSVLNNPPPTPSAMIPATVDEVPRRRSQHKKNQKPRGTWKLFPMLPSTKAVETLKQNVPKDAVMKAANKLYKYRIEDYAKKHEMGHTDLMSLVHCQKKLESRLAYIAPILDKMARKPEYLTIKNDRGHDALYLAAINCPQLPFVTGVLASIIEKSWTGVWNRTYNEKLDTLIHVVAAQGNTHENVLQELLAVQENSKYTFFDLSATNSDGKTPLHVAVEADDPMGTGIRTANIVKLLVEHGADPIVKDKISGNTALHMVLANTCCPKIVEVLLSNERSRKAINIPNSDGETPVHLVFAALNPAGMNREAEECWRLIAEASQSNIPN